MQTLDIAWLAGIVEGEGFIGLGSGKYPLISVGMTDIDVIVKIHGLWTNGRNNIGKYRTKSPQKPMYVTRIHGSDAIAWMLTLYTLLGRRRRLKIRQVLDVWKQYSPTRLRRKGNSSGNQGLGVGLLGGSVS